MRIVSIAQNAPGPVALSRLVAGGARAIKVEPPWGDHLAMLSPSWYDELHAGVPIERLDLKSPAGKARLDTLLRDADLFLASHRPSALARLALDAVSLQSRFSQLRHVNIVGDTADPEEPGHDLTYLARAGLLGHTMPLTLFADMATAERARAAIVEVMQEPGGRRVIGLFDVVRDLGAPLRHGLTIAGGPLGGGNPAYALYETKAGRIAVAALEPHFRAALYEGLALPDGADLHAVFLERTAKEWEEWAKSRDVPLVECLAPR